MSELAWKRVGCLRTLLRLGRGAVVYGPTLAGKTATWKLAAELDRVKCGSRQVGVRDGNLPGD